MAGLLLIVDDDPVQRRLLEEMVRRFGYEAETAAGGEEALSRIFSKPPRPLDLIILDLMMPGLDGMGVLARLAAEKCALPVIVQTARGGIEHVIAAMRAGAFDFIVKPVGPERLQGAIKAALKVTALEGRVRRAERAASLPPALAEMVTQSPEMAHALRLGARAAHSTIPVLIEGESGTGKERIARAIEAASDRHGHPFVIVNCGAIPSTLVESTLFGHEKGAFTGAVERASGKFQEAHGGTLFLDEVGELPFEAQVKLLRALQEGEIEPVGASRPVKVDFRLISATNRRLVDLVKEGRFREDLYYRLNVFPIFLPPLRARREDIPALAAHFIARFAPEEGGHFVREIAPEALGLLQEYDWPGNIRELENAIFRAVVLADSPLLSLKEFPQIAARMGHESALHHVREREALPGAPLAPASDALIGTAIPAASGAFDPAPFGFLRMLAADGHVRPLERIEEEMIRLALDHYGGRLTEVARRLGIGRSTLYRKLKDYGLINEVAQKGVASR